MTTTTHGTATWQSRRAGSDVTLQLSHIQPSSTPLPSSQDDIISVRCNPPSRWVVVDAQQCFQDASTYLSPQDERFSHQLSDSHTELNAHVFKSLYDVCQIARRIEGEDIGGWCVTSGRGIDVAEADHLSNSLWCIGRSRQEDGA